MSPEHADRVRAILYATHGWLELALHFPKFKDAIAALPDETHVGECNVMMREMYSDVKARAEQDGD